jgi:N-acetylmuramic acid 6-phosphate etherase
MSADIPDRSHVLTEHRNPITMALDVATVRQCVALINGEDATVAYAVRSAADALCRFIEAVEAGMRRGGRLVYVGAGTSGRLGVLDASECPPTFQTPAGLVVGLIAGGDSALRHSSEGMEDDPKGAWLEMEALGLTPNDSVLGIAAGGTTPYVLGGVEFARRAGAINGLLTCSPPRNRIAVDHLIVIETGPEVVTGSTRMKACTATKMALNTISTALMVRLGKVHENLMVDLRATNDKLRDRAARIIRELTDLSREDAFALLDSAGGGVKTAIVMHTLSVNREQAEARLAAADGVLRRALDRSAKPSARV